MHGRGYAVGVPALNMTELRWVNLCHCVFCCNFKDCFNLSHRHMGWRAVRAPTGDLKAGGIPHLGHGFLESGLLRFLIFRRPVGHLPSGRLRCGSLEENKSC